MTGLGWVAGGMPAGCFQSPDGATFQMGALIGARTVTGADVAAEARRWIGTRYRHQGRSREGVDCIGLPVCVRAELGLSSLDAEPYSRKTTDTAMLDFCRRHMLEISRSELQPGDVIVQMSGMVRHMAIVGDYLFGGLSIIHAWAPNKKVCECRLDDSFLADVRGRFRFPEIT